MGHGNVLYPLVKITYWHYICLYRKEAEENKSLREKLKKHQSKKFLKTPEKDNFISFQKYVFDFYQYHYINDKYTHASSGMRPSRVIEKNLKAYSESFLISSNDSFKEIFAFNKLSFKWQINKVLVCKMYPNYNEVYKKLDEIVTATLKTLADKKICTN